MTGVRQDELLPKALHAYRKFKAAGFEVFSPVLEENVEFSPEPLLNVQSRSLDPLWAVDKHMIKSKCDILVDLDGEKHSMGVKREYGLMRYFLWRPVVTVVPQGYPYSIADIEDDVLCNNVDQAIFFLLLRYGSRWSLRWLFERLAMFVRGQVELLKCQLMGLI
jgi:hypothetical protein